MTLEQLSLISQIIGALAVVGSLIFVGLQMRQAEKTQRAAMHQARADRIIGVFNNQAQPHMAAMFARLFRSPETLSGEDFALLRSAIMSLVINLEDQLWQQKAGLLEAATVRRTRHNSRSFFATPAVRAAWMLLRPTMDPDQLATIEREIIEGQPVQLSPDFLSLWQKGIAEIKAQSQASP